MPYVKRDEQGKIIALFQSEQNEKLEFLPSRNSEIIQFLTSETGTALDVLHALAKSDSDIARVTEDLIALLIEKQVILFTELPVAVQQKLINRAKLRATLNTEENNFLDEEDSL